MSAAAPVPAVPSRGTGLVVRLVALRALVTLALGLPAWLVAWRGIADGAARRPWFTDVTGPLPVAQLVRFLADLPAAYAAMLALAAVGAVVVDQLLTGAALVAVDPAWRAVTRPDPLRAACRDGARYIYRFARALLLAAIAGGIGLRLVALAVRRLQRAGDDAGWTFLTQRVTLPATAALVALAWSALVAAFLLWLRVISVADDRHRVRRTAWLVLRAGVRRPLSVVGIVTAAQAGIALAPFALLLPWRAAPHGTSAVALFVALVVALQVAQAAAWLALLRFASALWRTGPIGQLREMPDEPFRWVRRGVSWTRSRLRRTRANKPEVAPPSV